MSSLRCGEYIPRETPTATAVTVTTGYAPQNKIINNNNKKTKCNKKREIAKAYN